MLKLKYENEAKNSQFYKLKWEETQHALGEIEEKLLEEVCVCVCAYIYIYVCVCVCVREREIVCVWITN